MSFNCAARARYNKHDITDKEDDRGTSVGKIKLPHRFSIENVCSSKTKRFYAPYCQSQALKPVSSSQKIQTGKPPPNIPISATQRLFDKNRPLSSVFSYTNKGKVPEIPINYLRGRSLPHDLPAFWTLHCAPRIFQNFELVGRSSSKKRYESSSLPRRFLARQSRSYSTSVPNGRGSCTSKIFGLASKSGKINRGTPESTGVPGYNLGHKKQQSRTSLAEKGRHFKRPDENSFFRPVGLESGKIGIRKNELCYVRCSPGPVAYETNAKGQFKSPREEPESKMRNSTRGTLGMQMVDKKHKQMLPFVSTQPRDIPSNRRKQLRLGCTNQKQTFKWSLVNSSSAVAHKLQGNVSNLRNFEKIRLDFQGKDNFSSVRQSNGCILPKEPGGNEIQKAFRYDKGCFATSKKMRDNITSAIHPGHIQQCSRQLIEEEDPSRLALTSKYNQSNISDLGHPPDRSFRDQFIESGGELRIKGYKGSQCGIPKRIQSNLELQTCLGLPSSQSYTQGPTTSGNSQRNIHSNSPQLEQSVLDGGPESTFSRSSPTVDKLTPTHDRRGNSVTSSSGSEIEFAGMESTGWSNLINKWAASDIALLEKSWRKSSLKTYINPWRTWVGWCKQHHVTPNNPNPESVARFLSFLYQEKGFAPNTVKLHKSVIATFADPLNSENISGNPLVKRIIKAIDLDRPTSNRKTIWDVNQLICWMQSETIDENSIFQVSRRLALIFLLASGRRVHDLTLLKINDASMQVNEDSIHFWPEFGSKTDKPSYRQSGWKLLKHPDKQFDPIFWTLKLLEITSQRRKANEGTDTLFISTRGRVGPASRAAIAGWIKTAFVGAKIDYSPGSIRSAVSSSRFINEMPLDTIIKSANWKGEFNFFKHYFKEIEIFKSPQTQKAKSSCDSLFIPI